MQNLILSQRMQETALYCKCSNEERKGQKGFGGLIVHINFQHIKMPFVFSPSS